MQLYRPVQYYIVVIVRQTDQYTVYMACTVYIIVIVEFMIL